MRMRIAIALLLCASAALAQDLPSGGGSGTGTITINSTSTSGGAANRVLTDDGSKVQEVPYGATGNSTIPITSAGGLLNPVILPLATNLAKGGVQCDGATLTCVAGVASTIQVATTLPAGTSVTLVAPRYYFVCTGACTITVPVPAAGYEFCVLSDDNVSTVITLSAIGSSARYENTARTAYGTAGTGTFVSGGAIGDKICILGRDSTHYLTASFTGTWTAN